MPADQMPHYSTSIGSMKVEATAGAVASRVARCAYALAFLRSCAVGCLPVFGSIQPLPSRAATTV